MKRNTIIAAFTLFISLSAQGFELDPEDIRGDSDKKPVKVLQSRFFKKTLRPELGLIVGNIRDEAYLKTYTHGVRLGLFLTEWVGIDLQHMTTTVKDSEDRKALSKLVYRPADQNDERTFVSPDPETNAVHKITDINFIAAPFYGKINLVDLMIVYFDLYVTGGISSVDTDQGRKTAFNIGIGERFYFSDSLSFRVDFRDRIYKEQRSKKETSKELISIDFGLSYFFL
jgi:outer membrane beta-barrel protein